MNEDRIQYYTKQFKDLTNEELIRHLADGKNAFQEGVYDLILSEALSRGMSNTTIETRASESKKRDLKMTVTTLAIVGYVLSGSLLGIPGLIIGPTLLKIAKTEDLDKTTNAHTHGIAITAIGASLFGIVTIIGVISIILRLFR